MDNPGVFAGNLNRILLVDDLQDNAARLETYLATHNIQLIAAEHSDEALALLSALQPDLILINESLPEQQCKTLIQNLQAHPKACHIPIILLTRHVQANPEHVSFTHLDRLIKPVNPHALMKMLYTYAHMLACRKVVSALHNHHDQLLEAKNEGLMGLNHLGQIVYANNAGTRLLGFKPSVLLEVYIESLFEGHRTQVGSQWMNHPIAKICEEKNILQIEKTFFWNAAGMQLPVKFAAVPVFDEPLISVVIAFQLRETETPVFTQDPSDFTDSPFEDDKLDIAEMESITSPVEVAAPALPAAKQSRSVKTETQTQNIAISSPQAQAMLPAELVLNDYLQKVYDAAALHGAATIYLFQVNHWRHLLEGLGREITPQVIKAIRKIVVEQLPATIAVDYLENGQFCLLSNSVAERSVMTEVAHRLQALLAKPLTCLEHTLFLSVCVGGALLKDEALPQVSTHLRQALLIAQDESTDGVAVMMTADAAPAALSTTVQDGEQIAVDIKQIPGRRAEPSPSQLVNPLNQSWLRNQSPELQLRPFFDLQNNMIMGLNVSPLYQHPTLAWQELDALCVYYRSSPDFIAIAQRLIELFMQRLAQELRGEDLPASCQICLKIPAALLGVADFYAGFIQSLSAAGIAGESLWIELPESAWRVNSPIFLANIKAMHLHGIGLVVSEFGQALAPLALLDKLPISAIKFASKITDHADLYRDKLWIKTLKELAQSNQIKLWATQFTKQSRSMLVSQLGITLTDGPSFEFSESGLSVAEFYALTQEVCLNTDVVD